jgi:stress response protein SCP2
MSFRETGKRSPGLAISRNPTWLSSNNGLLIPAPPSGKSIVIHDILISSGSGKLGTAASGGGTRICVANQGANSYSVPTITPKNQAVYTDISAYITVTYDIIDGLPDGLVTNIVSGGGGTTTTAVPATNLAFAVATSSVTEGNSGTSTHTVTVNRSENTSSGTATVDYATGNVTANAGTDYTATNGTLTFAEGVTSQTMSITITGDTGNEDSETFNITLSNPTQTIGTVAITGTNPHVVTITNDDTSTIGFSAATSSVAEGASGTSTHTIAVTRSDTNGTATVNYVTANGTATAGTDYTAASGTLSFANGVSSMNVSVTISGDLTVESNETFTVTLSSATSQYGAAALGTSTHTVTITNDDAATTTTAAPTTTTAAPTTTTAAPTTTTAAAMSNLCISGAYMSEVDTTWVPVTDLNGYPQWYNQGENATDMYLFWSSNTWYITDDYRDVTMAWFSSDDDEALPWNADWTTASITITEGNC